jgi:hypothetical protein
MWCVPNWGGSKINPNNGSDARVHAVSRWMAFPQTETVGKKKQQNKKDLFILFLEQTHAFIRCVWEARKFLCFSL